MSTDPAFLANTAGCSRDLIESFVAYATKRIAPLRDGRIAVIYPFGMVDFIGHYAFDAHALRQLFPAERHQIFWIRPRPTRQVNHAMIEIATREIVLIDADDFPVEDLVRLAVTIFLHSWAFQFGDHIFAFGGISRAVREQYYRHLRAGRPETPLRLTPAEEDRADTLMRDLGIEAGAEFAVLHVREGGYNQRDRFNSFRDSDIRKYDAAIDLLVRNGLTVVRIGDPSMRPLEKKIAADRRSRHPGGQGSGGGCLCYRQVCLHGPHRLGARRSCPSLHQAAVRYQLLLLRILDTCSG